MSAGRRRLVIDLFVAGLAGVLALAVYVRSLAPGLLWGDSAEFQFAAWLGGFAHPTGYPLYLMLGWLWSHLLPLGDPAFRMNLFSAVWGAVAVGLLCLLVMRILRFLEPRATAGRPYLAASRLIALGAALVFTFTPTFWSQAVIAEVYTLHAAFVAGLLLALVIWAQRAMDGDEGDARRAMYSIALLFGLSMAHHRSTLLLAPAAALFVLIVVSRSGRHPRVSARQAALVAVCFLAPLLLYLYIPLRAPHVPYYAVPLEAGRSLPLYDPTPAGFLAHVSGSVFSSALATPRGALDLAALAGRFLDELSLNALVLGGLGLGYLVYRGVRARSWQAWSALALTGLFFLAQVAFNLFYAIGDIHVFYIPAYLVWVVWMALGAWALVLLVAWLFSGPGEQWRDRAAAGAGGLALVVLLAFAYRSAAVFWPKVQRAGDDSARRAWAALLGGDLRQGAILVSNDRDEMAPLWYLAHVEDARADLTGLFPLIAPGPAWSDVGAVVESALQTGRPVYLVKPMPGLEVTYDLATAAGESAGPLGPAVSVARLSDTSPMHPVDIVYGDTVRLLGYDVSPDPLVPGQPAQVTLYWQPLRDIDENWTTYVQVVGAAGEKAGQSDHQVGGVFYPSGLWRVGETLRDAHTFNIAPDVARGPRQLVVGLYVPSEGDLRQLGEPQAVGEVGVAQ